LEGHINRTGHAALGQQLFHVAVAEGEAKVEPDGVLAADSSCWSRGKHCRKLRRRDTPGDHADVLSGVGALAFDVECGIGAVLAKRCFA
jgi:hypothetical protein